MAAARAIVLGGVDARAGSWIEDQLFGTVGLDLAVPLAEQIALAVGARGIRQEGAIRFVSTGIDNGIDVHCIRLVGAIDIFSNGAAAPLLVIAESSGAGALLQCGGIARTVHPIIARIWPQEACIRGQQLAHLAYRERLEVG